MFLHAYNGKKLFNVAQPPAFYDSVAGVDHNKYFYFPRDQIVGKILNLVS